MAHHSILAIHDRIDEEHFELHLHRAAIDALQRRVNLLEAAVRDLRRLALDDEDLEHAADTAHELSRQRDRRKPPPRRAARADRRTPETAD